MFIWSSHKRRQCCPSFWRLWFFMWSHAGRLLPYNWDWRSLDKHWILQVCSQCCCGLFGRCCDWVVVSGVVSVWSLLSVQQVQWIRVGQWGWLLFVQVAVVSVVVVVVVVVRLWWPLMSSTDVQKNPNLKISDIYFCFLTTRETRSKEGSAVQKSWTHTRMQTHTQRAGERESNWKPTPSYLWNALKPLK